MIDFNDPSKWVVLRYRPASGGKFLCSCLLTIDRIAHWDQRVHTKEISFHSWVDSLWSEEPWIIKEPMHDWGTTFFSRTFPRGNNLTLAEYNQQMNTTMSDYAKEIWNSDYLLLDFLNKNDVPTWWSQSYILNLDAPLNNYSYQQMLLAKLYPYDTLTCTGISMMDKPIDYASTNNTLVESNNNAAKYSNQWKFGPFNNADEWYNYVITNDFRINFNLQNVDIYLDQLLEFNQIERFIANVSANLNSNYNKDNLKYLHSFWLDKNKKYLKDID